MFIYIFFYTYILYISIYTQHTIQYVLYILFLYFSSLSRLWACNQSRRIFIKLLFKYSFHWFCENNISWTIFSQAYNLDIVFFFLRYAVNFYCRIAGPFPLSHNGQTNFRFRFQIRCVLKVLNTVFFFGNIINYLWMVWLWKLKMDSGHLQKRQLN